jgi:hypothetical protein
LSEVPFRFIAAARESPGFAVLEYKRITYFRKLQEKFLADRMEVFTHNGRGGGKLY